MKRGFGFDYFDDDIDTGPAARRARRDGAETPEMIAARARWRAEDERELRELYARAGVWSRR